MINDFSDFNGNGSSDSNQPLQRINTLNSVIPDGTSFILEVVADVNTSGELVGLDNVVLSGTVGAGGPAPIPLPATLPLLLAGLGGLVLARRR